MSPVRRFIPSVAALFIALLSFACTEPNKAPGSVWVAYSTKPGDELLFTWIFTVDGAHVRAIKSNTTGNTRIDSLSPGTHRLLVAGLPAACTSGADDRTIDIPAGDTLSVSVAVTCTRTTGDITLSVTTVGSERDPDGYGVNLDGTPRSFFPPVSAPAIMFAKLTPGNHTVALTGVASNCTVADGATRTVAVTADKQTAVSMTVSCVAVSGTLRVTTATTGATADLDPNSYRVVVGTQLPLFMPANATSSFTVIGGTYPVRLADVEPNCTVASNSPSVTVPVGGTTDVTFNVSCGAYPATTAGAAFTDPANDTLPNAANAPTKSSDLIGVTTAYGPGFMTVTLRFSRAIGADQQLIGFLDFDTDENSATGFPPLLNSFGGTVSQGVEARAAFRIGPTGTTATGDVSVGNTFGPIRVSVGGDSVHMIIPDERLNDDGNVTMSVILGSNDRPTDLMPNGNVALVLRRPAGSPTGPSSVLQLQPAASAPRALPSAWKRVK
ncbi:MAG: hypothetical protein ABIR92_05510 [Gemmatimonadaceae bacterium]